MSSLSLSRFFAALTEHFALVLLDEDVQELPAGLFALVVELAHSVELVTEIPFRSALVIVENEFDSRHIEASRKLTNDAHGRLPVTLFVALDLRQVCAVQLVHLSVCYLAFLADGDETLCETRSAIHMSDNTVATLQWRISIR